MKDDPFVLEWKDNHIRSWKTTDDGKKVAEEEMFTFIWNGKQYSTWLYYGRDWSKGGKPKYTKYVRIPDEKTILYITGLRNNEPRIRQVQGQRDGSKKSGEREIVLAVQSDKPILFDWQGKKYWVPAIAYKEKLDIFLIDFTLLRCPSRSSIYR